LRRHRRSPSLPFYFYRSAPAPAAVSGKPQSLWVPYPIARRLSSFPAAKKGLPAFFHRLGVSPLVLKRLPKNNRARLFNARDLNIF
jgi:hypothetical protein